MVGAPDDSSPVFAFESFTEIEAKARDFLRERGFSEDQINAQLAKTMRDHIDWLPPPSTGPDHSSSNADNGK